MNFSSGPEVVNYEYTHSPADVTSITIIVILVTSAVPIYLDVTSITISGTQNVQLINTTSYYEYNHEVVQCS